jgi:hypothetical protein
MPLLATLAAIAGIVAAGTSVGVEGYQLANQPSTPKTPAAVPPPGPTPAQQAQTAANQTAAVGQQAPTLEGLTSGFANPGYYAQQGALAAGVAGQPGGQGSAAAAIEQTFGLPPGTLTGGGGTAPSSAAKPFQPAGVGDPSQGAFPASTTDLSSFVSTFFKG